jgi:DnaJ like chaperone protein
LDYKGKILGAAVGAVIFQVVGALVGLILGHYLIDHKRMSAIDLAYKKTKKREKLFLEHAFALCAKIAKAKGAINHYEIAFMERMITHQFKLTPEGRKQAIQIWNTSKNTERPFEEFAQEFYNEFANERHHIVNMMDLLIGIAACDQSLHPKEEALILKASGLFRISKLQFERIKGRHIASSKPAEKWTPLDPHYAILGATPQDDLSTIKRKYRALAKKWHPDTLSSQKASKEALRHASKKFQEITEAYETISQRLSVG